MQQLGRDRVAPPHQVEVVRGPGDQFTGQRPLAGKAQAAVRRSEQVRLAVVEPQAQAVAVQQHQFTVDAGKRGERSIALDLGDRKPPGPVAAGTGAMRMDTPGPAQAVTPVLTAILVAADDPAPTSRVAPPPPLPPPHPPPAHPLPAPP